VVQVGQNGVTEAVVEATTQALLDHELIKVRLHEPDDKKAMADELATATGAQLCGLIGHTVILYKRHPEEPKIKVPSKQI
jgi:RNA-binding protein